MILGICGCKKSNASTEESDPSVTSSVVSDTNSKPTESSEESPDESEPAESDVSESVHVHSYTSKVTNPDCITRGYTTYTCNCGYSYTGNYKDIYGHSYTKWVTVKAATTSNTGLEERKCERCGLEESQIIPKKIDTSTIDKGITVKTSVWGNIEYEFKNCSVNDTRSWGAPPIITIGENDSMHVTYYNKNNEKVEFVALQIADDNWTNLYTILDDGTWVSRPIGPYT